MDTSFIEEILKIGGQAGVLWFAIWKLSNSLKTQYENQIKELSDALKTQKDSHEKEIAAVREMQKVQSDQQQNRIEAVERAAERCETERQKLSSEINTIHSDNAKRSHTMAEALSKLLGGKSDS